jgi:hypothetical protein
MTDEPKADPELSALLREARELGIVVEDNTEEYGDHLTFNLTRMAVPSVGGGHVQQALAFLAKPANRGIKTQLADAVKEVSRHQKVAA